jgi:hypothetical protein
MNKMHAGSLAELVRMAGILQNSPLALDLVRLAEKTAYARRVSILGQRAFEPREL